MITGTKRFKAIESISARDTVYITQSDVLDYFSPYANTTALQAEWVDSDAGNKMSALSASASANPGASASMLLTAVAGNNTNDYVDNTITSKDLTGYTVNILIKASATSGDWEFLLASGANAATSNVKQAITVSAANTPQLLSFTVAGMTADNGVYDPAATIHVGVRCVDDTGGPTIDIYRIWWTKSGTTYNGVKKTFSDYAAINDLGTYGTVCIGIAPAAITASNYGSILLSGTVLSGFSNLITGLIYYLSSQTAGAITFIQGSPPGISEFSSGFVTQIGIAISETELLVKVDMGDV